MRFAAQTRDSFVLSLIGATISLIAVYASEDTTQALLIIGPLTVGLLVWFALTRFELFTLVMIATRTSIELIPFSVSTDLLRLSVLATGAYTLGGVVWLARGKATRRPSLLAWATIGVAGAATVAAVLSPDPLGAGMGASRWIFLAVFVLVMERLLADSSGHFQVLWSKKSPKLESGGSERFGFVDLALVAFAISMIVPLGLGAWQIATNTSSLITGASRVEGSFSHPNTFGFYLVIMILGLLAIAPRLPRFTRLVSSLLAALATVELAATYSRTSYLALAVGIVVLIVVGRRWILLGMAVVVITAAALIPGVSQRWADLDEEVTLRGTPGNALAWRVDYWESVIDASAERRVTGLGLGVVSESTEEEREPHNDFVRAFAELGIVGLVAYLSLLAVLARRSTLGVLAKRRAAPGEPIVEGISEGFAGVTAAYLLASVTGNLMTQLVLLWYVLGFAVLAGAGTWDRWHIFPSRRTHA